MSATAVSLALKGSARVSGTLRAQVAKLAKAEGYVPNARLTQIMSEVRQSEKGGYRATLAAFSLFPDPEPWHTGYPHLKPFLDGARERGAEHGYRLEYFWLKQPGMTVARFASLLGARGIQGLLCLGSRNPEERLPDELYRFSVVTFAASIPSRLHRVASNFTTDARLLFSQLAQRGYGRPGLIILQSGDRRTNFSYSEAFLGVQERSLPPPRVPILRAEEWNEAEFEAWIEAHRPDVLVLHEHREYLAAMEAYLRRRRLAIPRTVGLALLDLNPDLTHYTGICQNYPLMGATAVEMLIGRVILRDFGVPEHPKVEMVAGYWNEGESLCPAERTRARKKAVAGGRMSRPLQDAARGAG